MLQGLTKFFRARRQAARAGRLCISATPQGLMLAHVVNSDLTLPELHLCHFEACAVNDYSRVLSELLERYQLADLNCSWLINANAYRLLMVEKPAVPDPELIAATKWQVRDLVSYPLDDLVLEVIKISKPVGGRDMLYVPTTQRSQLQADVAMLRDAGYNLTTVDIADLGLRNLIASYAADNQGIALIYLQADLMRIVIVNKESLYLTRTLEIAWDTLVNLANDPSAGAEQLDQLALEIQRSLDYYASQFRAGSISQLLFHVDLEDRDNLCRALAERLAQPVQLLDFARLLNFMVAIDYDLLSQCLPVIGGALRP